VASMCLPWVYGLRPWRIANSAHLVTPSRDLRPCQFPSVAPHSLMEGQGRVVVPGDGNLTLTLIPKVVRPVTYPASARLFAPPPAKAVIHPQKITPKLFVPDNLPATALFPTICAGNHAQPTDSRDLWGWGDGVPQTKESSQFGNRFDCQSSTDQALTARSFLARTPNTQPRLALAR
jgi:hypothetical protein